MWVLMRKKTEIRPSLITLSSIFYGYGSSNDHSIININLSLIISFNPFCIPFFALSIFVSIQYIVLFFLPVLPLSVFFVPYRTFRHCLVIVIRIHECIIAQQAYVRNKAVSIKLWLVCCTWLRR